jgi:hypothetical protein
MSSAEENRVLAEAARAVASEHADSLKIVIVEHGHAAGIVANLLVRSHGLPKNRVSQLGYVASDEQNLAILRKADPVVVVPKEILVNRPTRFFPPKGAKEAAIIDATGCQVRVSRQPRGEEPFELKQG